MNCDVHTGGVYGLHTRYISKSTKIGVLKEILTKWIFSDQSQNNPHVWITYLMPGTGHIFWFCWIEFPGPVAESGLFPSYH